MLAGLLCLAWLAQAAHARESTAFRISFMAAISGELSQDDSSLGSTLDGSPTPPKRYTRESHYTDILGGSVSISHDARPAAGAHPSDHDPNILALVCLGDAIFLQVRSAATAMARLNQTQASSGDPIMVIPSGW